MWRCPEHLMSVFVVWWSFLIWIMESCFCWVWISGIGTLLFNRNGLPLPLFTFPRGCSVHIQRCPQNQRLQSKGNDDSSLRSKMNVGWTSVPVSYCLHWFIVILRKTEFIFSCENCRQLMQNILEVRVSSGCLRNMLVVLLMGITD